MLVKICVPSKARAEIFSRKTLLVLRHTRLPWSVFVEPQDAVAYMKKVPSGNVVVLRMDNQGLGYALYEIRKHCASTYEFVWKMDDDIHHWYQSSKTDTKESQGGFLDSIAKILFQANRALGDTLGGISFPNKLFHTDWRPFTHVNKMFSTTFIVRTSNWLTPLCTKGYHEEFIASARLVLDNKIIPHVGLYCWAADLSSYPGGLQAFDRESEQARFYCVLEEEFPHLASMTRRRQYTQKTGKVFTVTDKTVFNQLNAQKLSGKTLSELLKEIACLSKSRS